MLEWCIEIRGGAYVPIVSGIRIPQKNPAMHSITTSLRLGRKTGFTKVTGLGFRASLAGVGVERLELVRV